MSRVEVAIVGAGFAGLGMAIALRRSGRDDRDLDAAHRAGSW